MSLRYHVVSKFVEYGDACSGGCNMPDLIDEIFNQYDSFYRDENETSIEIGKEDLKQAIKDLKDKNSFMIDRIIDEFNNRSYVTEKYKREDLISFFEQCLNDCDKRGDYVKLDLF